MFESVIVRQKRMFAGTVLAAILAAAGIPFLGAVVLSVCEPWRPAATIAAERCRGCAAQPVRAAARPASERVDVMALALINR